MMNFLRKHMRTIFVITILGFLAGAFVGFGSYFFSGKTTADAVVEVNGEQIPYKRYENYLNRALDGMRQQKQEVSDETMKQKKQEVLQDLIQEVVFSKEALKYGITVSDGELAADIQHYPAFQREGRFDRNAYFQVVYQVLRTTPKEFEDSRRDQIAIFKLRQLIASGVPITEPELKLEYFNANHGNMKDFEKDRAKFSEKIKQEKTMLAFGEWFKTLNQNMKIKVHLQEIEKQG
jgi:peptidyl-prolyl cis-trans isomerase D